MIIPYKEINYLFTTIYGIIAESLPPSFRERSVIVVTDVITHGFINSTPSSVNHNGH